MARDRDGKWSGAVTAAVLACTGTWALADPPSGSYRLVFADEFNGTSLNTAKWSAASPGWTMPNSLSTASASQVSVANGSLTLNATRTGSSTWSSGSIAGYGKYNFDGGYVEARIDLPSTPGSWPAFWGLYNGWPPEADIMEYPLTTNGSSGYANNQYSTNFHYTDSNNNAAAGAGVVTTGTNLGTSGWHTFGMSWVSDTSVSFYLDGTKVQSYTGSAVAQMVNMYMILDYAVGGWPGTPSTSQWAIGASDQMKVDYVRVYQNNPNTSTDAPSSWKVNGSGSFGSSANWTSGAPTYGNQTAVFGRVGTAATASISMPSFAVTGGMLFQGGSDGTTAYTIGSASNAIQLASTTGSVSVTADATSTADQTINAGVELWSNTTFRNQMAANSLIFNGVIAGNGDLTVSGPGVVVFSNNNTYTGDTYIGSAGSPTATALVTRSRPFGSSGTVYLNLQGNANAATIQIQDNRSVPNTIEFAGRGSSAANNFTPGIQNLAGNNEFSGTINLVRGGSNYIAQSDAGLLTLSGSVDPATPGVALQVDPTVTGTRLFTLNGAGNGQITGTIQNGGGTLALAKGGAGPWTLAKSNTFTGGVTVSAGTLMAADNAALGAGAVGVANGATLGVAQGYTVGGLTGLTLASGSTLSLASSAVSLSTGTFVLGDITLDLNHAYDASGLYTLINGAAAGNTIGAITFADADTAHYQYQLNLVGNNAVLTVASLASVPEPASLTLLAGTTLLALRRRRSA
ncbi:MAG: family 16 glycosylhydrolase [Tepidisphaeraceae bacterium]